MVTYGPNPFRGSAPSGWENAYLYLDSGGSLQTLSGQSRVIPYVGASGSVHTWQLVDVLSPSATTTTTITLLSTCQFRFRVFRSSGINSTTATTIMWAESNPECVATTLHALESVSPFNEVATIEP